MAVIPDMVLCSVFSDVNFDGKWFIIPCLVWKMWITGHLLILYIGWHPRSAFQFFYFFICFSHINWLVNHNHDGVRKIHITERCLVYPDYVDLVSTMFLDLFIVPNLTTTMPILMRNHGLFFFFFLFFSF